VIITSLFQVKSVGPWMITREIIKNEGFKGMFRGLVPTFAREMPGIIK
jgi:solute carrier family 25 ornithine transporter 2/15